jgi:uncharacterized protein YbjT (DUF2867 family)
MGKIVNVIGATGLVGRELVRQLLENREIEKVRIFVRREFDSLHLKLEQHVIGFDEIESWKSHLTGDALFSALGTTLKQAGSKNKQYLVDFTYQFRFAEEASKNGIPVYVLVSSAGANSRSLIFYSRMKGELEEEIQKLPFQKITIMRPSILAGIREKRRPAEEWSARMMEKITKFVLKKYKPIPAEAVAKAMINAVFLDNRSKIFIVNPDDIFKLAGF